MPLYSQLARSIETATSTGVIGVGERLEKGSLYTALQTLGVNLEIAHQRTSARLMSDVEAELLDEPLPWACLTVDRIADDDTGRFVEFGRHLYRAAHYNIQSNLLARRHTPTHPTRRRIPLPGSTG